MGIIRNRSSPVETIGGYGSGMSCADGRDDNIQVRVFGVVNPEERRQKNENQ